VQGRVQRPSWPLGNAKQRSYHPAVRQCRQDGGLLPVPADEIRPCRRQASHRPGHCPARPPCDHHASVAMTPGQGRSRGVGGLCQHFPVGRGQLKCLRYQPHRRQPRCSSPTLLDRSDRGRTDPASIGESLLGEAGRHQEPAQQVTKGIGHRRNTPLAPGESRAPPRTGQPCAPPETSPRQ
jgi:hypothetical protein